MNLKVGDELAFHYHRGPGCPYVILPITKITPTGIIKCGDFSLNPDLTIKGDRSWSDPIMAEPVTNKIRLEMLRWKAADKLRRIDWTKVDDAVLFAVMELIHNKKKEAEHG